MSNQNLDEVSDEMNPLIIYQNKWTSKLNLRMILQMNFIIIVVL